MLPNTTRPTIKWTRTARDLRIRCKAWKNWTWLGPNSSNHQSSHVRSGISARRSWSRSSLFNSKQSCHEF